MPAEKIRIELQNHMVWYEKAIKQGSRYVSCPYNF